MRIIIVLLLLGPATRLALGDDPSEAERRLAAAGLNPVGRFWICSEEVELRRQLSALPGLERKFFAAQKKFKELVSTYNDYRGQLERAQSSIAENMERLATGSLSTSQRQQLENENQQHRDLLAKLKRSISEELNTLDENSPMTNAAIDVVNARNALAISVLSIRRHLAKLGPQYARLKNARAVAGALDILGRNQTLGPVEKYAAQYRRRLNRLAGAVFADGVPVYRRSGKYRLSVIIGEQTPATFSYTGPQGPTVVPASLLQSVGLEPDRLAMAEVFKEGNRSITVRRVTIPELRVGSLVLRDVQALVLPPEAEDLGARISLAAFGDHPAALDAHQLWFRIAPP